MPVPAASGGSTLPPLLRVHLLGAVPAWGERGALYRSRLRAAMVTLREEVRDDPVLVEAIDSRLERLP